MYSSKPGCLAKNAPLTCKLVRCKAGRNTNTRLAGAANSRLISNYLRFSIFLLCFLITLLMFLDHSTYVYLCLIVCLLKSKISTLLRANTEAMQMR